MHSILKEIRDVAFTRTNLILWTLATLSLAAAGPFGTFDTMPIVQRLVYWGMVVVISAVLGNSMVVAARLVVADDKPVVRDMIVLALMTVVFSPVLWGLTQVFLTMPPDGKPGLLTMAGYVVPITMTILVARRLLPGFERETYFASRSQNPPSPRLARRLPQPFSGEILRLAVDDHHVTVVTTVGTFSIRLRFSDAIDEMDTVEGFCTHRSHWVAVRAIAGSERDNGKTHMRLSNGDKVPVSRTYRPDLEAAGLL